MSASMFSSDPGPSREKLVCSRVKGTSITSNEPPETWDILILFGGGFALAKGFTDSGLTLAIANQLYILQGSNLLLIIVAITGVVIFLTEITSNTATASMFLPIIAALAVAMAVHPYGLMVAVALAASFAFMLPVATPPNAIAFSSHYFSIEQMARTGIWLNLFGIIMIALFVMFYLPLIWDIDLNIIPEEMARHANSISIR